MHRTENLRAGGRRTCVRRWGRLNLVAGGAAMAALWIAGSASAASIFTGNLVVSSLTYEGSASTIAVGQLLPNCSTYNSPCTGVQVRAIANGSFGQVFQNDGPDGNFGITAPYSLQFFSSNGTNAILRSTYDIPDSGFSGSFSSKSEGAINVSADGQSITLLGYNAGPNQIDISNANTPSGTETKNTDTAPRTYRTVAQVNSDGTVDFTNTDAYSGNNGRAVILGSNGQYYLVGNAGNGKGDGNTAGLNGVQSFAPGATPAPNGNSVGQYNITQNGYPPDKATKDNNFRGETIFDNTLYVTKGSGGNGINTVYQVGTQGTLPTGSANTISILPGLPTFLANTPPASLPAQFSDGFFPFGIWFANKDTLYVADEGDGTLADAATDPAAGLEKWSYNGAQWVLDYVLQNGLKLGQNYTVTGTDAAGDKGSYTTATDGLRNITGEVNKDGTVTIFGVTSTASVGTGDQGADPDELVAIVDTLSDTTASQASGESFLTLETAGYGQVLRGVALVAGPVPEPAEWAMLMLGFAGLGALLRRRRERGTAAIPA